MTLQCENPFVDDYYFTVYNQKKERAADGDGSDDQVLFLKIDLTCYELLAANGLRSLRI